LNCNLKICFRRIKGVLTMQGQVTHTFCKQAKQLFPILDGVENWGSHVISYEKNWAIC
jgi:hypothetical protein